MGVAGVGKSTVARRLADDLGLEFAEGDDFHPQSNIDKMSAGHALNDEDRWPWLEELAEWTAERRERGQSTVLTCSALRRVYRDVLRRPDPGTFFVHLHGSQELLRGRMQDRNHFMSATLLPSQFETLEQLDQDEAGVVVDIVASVDEVVAQVEARLQG
jgi:carbohydrate kinase (thermoresistant glucokinase family)